MNFSDFSLQRMLSMEKFTERKGIITDAKRKLRTVPRGFYGRNKTSGLNSHLSRFLTISGALPQWENLSEGKNTQSANALQRDDAIRSQLHSDSSRTASRHAIFATRTVPRW